MVHVDETGSSGREPPSSGATSRSLLERVKADDGAAWETLVGLYGPVVYRWVLRWHVSEHEAADVFSGCVSFARQEHRRVSQRECRRYVPRVAAPDHGQQSARPSSQAGPAAGWRWRRGTEAQLRLASLPDPSLREWEESGVGPDSAGLLRAAVELIRKEFEARTWQAFWMTAVDGKLPAEVAEELGMSPGAVRVAKSRVLKRLREELGGL